MNTTTHGPIPADRPASDASALVPTPAAATRAVDHVTAGEIAEFLHHLARFRSPAVGGQRGEHAALLARKTELLARIAGQHARTAPGPPPTTPPTTSMAPEGRTP
ncbi:MAG: hypothetical protein QOE61_1231 [Micromonosporaceae bacterium]|jgi:hypothetical protein|nr:hypothetical protein [Micromonosporaceae bacterium]